MKANISENAQLGTLLGIVTASIIGYGVLSYRVAKQAAQGAYTAPKATPKASA